MRSIIPMKMAKIGYMVLSTILMLLGTVIVISPQFFTSIISVMTAIAMVVFGVIKIIGYFSKDLYRLAFQYDMAFGILLIALGVTLLMKPSDMLYFLCIAIGIAVMADGLFKMQIALDARSFGIRKWWLVFLFALITGTVGLLLVFNPEGGLYFTMRILGLALLAEGVVNAITVLTSVKIIKHQRPDAVEGAWREI